MSGIEELSFLDEDEGKEFASLMSLLNEKGKCLDGFRRDYLELKKQTDLTESNAAAKERELESKLNELSSIKERISSSSRNIDDLLNSQIALKNVMENISNIKNALESREIESKEEISSYGNKYQELKDALTVGADWTAEQSEIKISLEKERDFNLGQLENETSNLNAIRAGIEDMYNRIQSYEKELAGKETLITTTNARIKEFRSQAKEMGMRREEKEQRVFELRQAIVASEETLKERRAAFKGEDRTLQDLDLSVSLAKEHMDSYLAEYDGLYKTLLNVTGDLDRHKAVNSQLEIEIEALERSIVEKKNELAAIGKEAATTIQLRDLARVKCTEADEEKVQWEQKRDVLQKRIGAIQQQDIVSAAKEIEQIDVQISNHKREVELLSRKKMGSEKAARAVEDLLQLNANNHKSLALEKKYHEDEVRAQKDKIKLLLTEKERLEHETEVLNQEYYTALEELKLQELQMDELQRKMLEDQAKLKNKQNLYDAVRSDRNLYSKQLMESQEEITSLRRKFRGMNHLINQLKDEITVKDHAIVKEHFLHHAVEKEKELLKNELLKIHKQVGSSEAIIANQTAELVKLVKIIEEAELERARQRNELTAVMGERNLLTGQIVKRNSELADVYDRIKIQRSIFRIGESHFNKIIGNISLWQKQMVHIVYEHADIMETLSVVDEQKRHIVRLDKEVRSEQSRARALADELEKPMNVHRWRILESSDPKRYEKIQLIQKLQKQVVEKSDEVTTCELLIQEKERVYVELKNIIARQPGPEVEEQVLLYQQTLKDKVKQLRGMEDELGMYRTQVAKFKEDMADMDAQMEKLKKRWVKTQRAKLADAGIV